MRVAVGGREASGRGVDLRDAAVDADTLVAAVRDPADDRVRCPDPGPAHEHVGLVGPDTTLSLRAALAAAARSRGASAPQDADAATAAAELDALDAPAVDLAAARERAADAGESVDALREEVARLRGQVEARREVGADAGAAEAALADAARRLSEAETERVAAEQALERARLAAREARDERERALELADRRDNRRREARAHLARETYDAFRTALDAVPGEASPGERPTAYAGDDVTAALAVARVAALDAPVVLGCGRFDDPVEAAETLDAPVLLV